MVTVSGVAAVLCLCWAVLAQGAAPDPLAAVLAPFPDNGLPALLVELEKGDPVDAAVTRRLAALGPAAHEALLGLAVRPLARREPPLAAFGEFDARAAWALPLLTHEANVGRPLAGELLVLLGPAAAPALPALRELAQGRFPFLAPVVDRIARASDRPLPAGPAPVRPRVAAASVPGLLERLRGGPPAQRWPSLQALLAAGDEAASAALLVLFELELRAEAHTDAVALQFALRCSYGARCLQGWQPFVGLLTAELPPEVRRCVLAGRAPRPEELRAWLDAADAGLRLSAVLALALADDWGQFNLWNPPVQDVDPFVQRAITLLQGVRRHRGAALGTEVLAALGRAATVAEQQQGIDRLHGHDLHDAPVDLWVQFLTLAQLPQGEPRSAPGASDSEAQQARIAEDRLRRSARGLLHGLAGRGEPLADELVGRLPAVLQTGDQELLRALVAAAAVPALAARIRAASEDPAALSGWLAVLQAAEYGQRQQVRALVGPALAGEVLRLPPDGQLDWLEQDRSATLPEAAWRALLAAPDVALRRRAIGAAMRRAPAAAVPVDLLIATLQDGDEQVATAAAMALANDRGAPDRALAALLARIATAPPTLHGFLVRKLRHRAPAAALRPTFDAAFANTAWQVRVPAAVALLEAEPTHAEAWAALRGYLEDRRPEVRRGAMWEAASCPAVAERCVDVAIERLADADELVKYDAVRLLGAAPAAKERTLPLLRALRERAPDSASGQRAQAAIEALEKAENGAAGGTRR